MNQAGIPALHLDKKILHTIWQLARQGNRQVWLTGGSLRDLLMGLEPPDTDLTVSRDALGLGEALAQEIKGRYVPLDLEHDTCRVVFNEFQIDITGLRAPTLEEDLQSRDFTVNALAWALEDYLHDKRKIIDPTGGLEHLNTRRLIPAGPGVLRDDPLRVLRAFRFMSTHNLELDSETKERLSAAASGLTRMPKERICHEWHLLMAGQGAALAVRAMDEAAVLTKLAPALEQGRGVAQNPYHHLDVMQHGLACLDALNMLARKPGDWLGSLSGEIQDYLAPARRRALLMTAALLHDLGKPATRIDKEAGWATFHRHDIQGAALARQTCQGLGFSKADISYVAYMVAGHMRPFHLMGAQRRGELTDRAVRRLLTAAGEDLPGLFLMALADTIAGKGPLRPPDAEEVLLDLYGQVARRRDERLAQALAAPPLINGHDLINETGLKPGPQVGKLLRAVREAQLDGRIKTPEEALKWARELQGKYSTD